MQKRLSLARSLMFCNFKQKIMNKRERIRKMMKNVLKMRKIMKNYEKL
jgi:hypothetical protein